MLLDCSEFTFSSSPFLSYPLPLFFSSYVTDLLPRLRAISYFINVTHDQSPLHLYTISTTDINMASPQPHSGLEVAPDTKSAYSYTNPNPTLSPQNSPIPPSSHPSPITPPSQPYPYPAPAAGQPLHPYPYPYPYAFPPTSKIISGLRRPTFCLSLTLIFVIIASGMGGGLGGTLAVRDIKRKW